MLAGERRLGAALGLLQALDDERREQVALGGELAVDAAHAGAGVGSVYRQFPSKRDLLAALVVERLQETERGAEAALAGEHDRWSALTGLLWMLAERQASDDVLGEAMATVSE